MKGLNMKVAQLLAFPVLSLTCPCRTGNHIFGFEVLRVVFVSPGTTNWPTASTILNMLAKETEGLILSMGEVQNVEQCYNSYLLRVGSSSSSFLTIILCFTASFRRKRLREPFSPIMRQIYGKILKMIPATARYAFLCTRIQPVKRIINITEKKSPESSQELLPPSVGSEAGGHSVDKVFIRDSLFPQFWLTESHLKCC